MAQLSDLSVDELIDVIRRARGCGCCSDTEIPDGCPVEESGWVDHTYSKGCSQSFDGLLDLLVETARKGH
jgi:hypothetical protein